MDRALGFFLYWASNGGHRTSLFIPNHLHDVGRAGSSAGYQWLIPLPVHVTMDSERLGIGSQIPRTKCRLGTLAVHHWARVAQSPSLRFRALSAEQEVFRSVLRQVSASSECVPVLY